MATKKKYESGQEITLKSLSVTDLAKKITEIDAVGVTYSSSAIGRDKTTGEFTIVIKIK